MAATHQESKNGKDDSEMKLIDWDSEREEIVLKVRHGRKGREGKGKEGVDG